jgi:hypothetical protein
MSQYDFGTMDPTTTSGSQLATVMNNLRDALISCHKGPSRPTYAVAGTIWLNDATPTAQALNFYDGTQDITFGYFNSTTHAFTPAVGLFNAAAAAGTVDAITATFTPAITLADKTICTVVAGGANTSTTPTFAPNGLTARTIVKQGGQALVAGDIPRAGFVALLQYDLANTRWELLNPANPTMMKTDVSAVRTKAHPCTKSAVTDNSLTPDLTTTEVFDWTPTEAATLNAPTITGAGVWVIRYNYSSGPTLPKTPIKSSVWKATGDILLIIGFGSADYELVWLNKA